MKLGTLIQNRYRIVRPLAKGGMANIYEGRDGTQRVVIKVLKEGLSKDPEIAARFDREVRTASSLKSKHVVRILGFGTTEHDEPFLVMELLFGNDLAKEIKKQRVLPLEEAASIVAQTCHAMIEAHQAGIVHRDLKPTNLYLAREAGKQVLKVLDFGIAKITGNDSEEQITRPTAVMGSPSYMSPETFKGAMHADARSDIWSLAVVFYEMLTGVVPFKGDNAGQVGVAVMRDAHVEPTQLRPELPRSVDVVIGRALKKAPDERYQTMRELLAAIEVYLPKGRNETMMLPQVTAPPDEDDQRTVRRDVSVTDFGMIDPKSAAGAEAADDEPSEAPTKIREPGAATDAAAVSPVAGPGDGELATLVKPAPIELSSEEFMLEESSVDGTAPAVVVDEPSKAADHAPSSGSAARPDLDAAAAAAEVDAFVVPKTKVPLAAWVGGGAALGIGLIAWALSGSASTPANAPPASESVANAHVATMTTVTATATASTPAPLTTVEAPPRASASTPSPDEVAESATAQPSASAPIVAKTPSTATPWKKPPPKVPPKKPAKFTPKKI